MQLKIEKSYEFFSNPKSFKEYMQNMGNVGRKIEKGPEMAIACLPWDQQSWRSQARPANNCIFRHLNLLAEQLAFNHNISLLSLLKSFLFHP